MAIGGSAMCLGLVLVALLRAGAMAQLDCTSAIYVMAPCLNFITGNSPNPSLSCCSRLFSVVKIQPRCLCSVLNGGGISLAFNINQTQALALPGACNVQTPSVSQCNFSNGSATSPTASPKDVPADSPAEKTPSTTPASKISPGAMDQSACTNVIVVMAPCLTFINGYSSSPSSSCCSQLASVVKSHPICLCSVLNGGASPTPINQTQALALPGACNVQTPPASQCNAANGPAISPTASPKDVPADSPAGKIPTTANTPAISPNIPADPATENTPTSSIPATPSNNIPSGNGSETTPNTGGAADGIVTKVSLHLRVFLLFIVACASTV